uniref:Plant UBX domain-containing protein 7-like n=1 Tax=Elaeis guineensis var. tenera TaxID=51953 RepID=A0A8N4ESM0_ELAGV
MYRDTDDGKKVCTYYNLVSLPAVLIIDPITGQKMHAWSGMIQAEQFLELKAILIYVAVREGSKKRIISNNNEIDTKKDEESSSSSSDCKTCTEKDNSSNEQFTYPILVEEPEPEGDRKQLCRVGICLPDGRRLQRNFHHSDPVKLLWSFCCTQFDKGKTRPF